MEQVLNQLPKGWINVQVKDVTKSLSSGFACNKSFETTDGYVHLRTHNISTSGCLNFDQMIKVSHEKIDEKKSKIFKGEILFNNTNSKELVGKTAYVDQDYDFAFSNHLTRIVPNDKVHSKFLVYWLVSLQTSGYFNQICKKWIGQAGVNNTVLKSLSVPLPSKEEQKRIVEKLDALLTRIDTAIEHLQSKLALSKQLFDSVLDEFFKLSDCDSVPLTEVVDFIGGSQPPKSQFSDVQKEGYVRLIQIRDYKTDNHIVYVDSASTKKFCTKEDVMIGRYGPPVFQILRGLDGAYNVALMKAVPNEDVLTKDYLFWFLQSPSIQNYVIGISQRAAGQSGVNKKALEKYLIPVPSKTIQNDIVDKVGQLVNKSRNLEAEVTAEITSLSQLKASILDSAFKGEL
ncbi:restriction endonuclease subunit S [Idiomarina sp.]|uniref:restriction endonuclease subunit S n=2 Tax=Idiomarina sp. TaxID=1874361 RepID=UPI00351802BB